MACSCSAHVTFDEFINVVEEVFKGKSVTYLDRTKQPLDHPAKIKEAQYLKAVYVRLP